jgi:hypothetical protein
MRLRKLWSQEPEITAEEIAEVLSAEFRIPITAEAVLGKVDRLKLKVRTVQSVKRKIQTPSLAPVYIRKDDPAVRTFHTHDPFRQRPVFTARILRANFDAEIHCGWDLGLKHVCGLKRKSGSPFCEKHAALGSKVSVPTRDGAPPSKWQNKFVNRAR